MQATFHKYQATGNDFILMDNRNGIWPREDQQLYAVLCHRRFGIGADGVILIEKAPQDLGDFDFEMVYFNADGNPGSMCGNGGRAAVLFAKQLGLVQTQANFLAYDGAHRAHIDPATGLVWLKMRAKDEIRQVGDNAFFVDTGSPHYVQFINSQTAAGLDAYPVVAEGRSIRFNPAFMPYGTNVNFVEVHPDKLRVRTYERGVEDETLSCGTGVTASALVYVTQFLKDDVFEVGVETPGGRLVVSRNDKHELFLIGPAEEVFVGSLAENANLAPLLQSLIK